MTAARVIPHLVSPREVVLLMREPDVRLVDVRWRLGNPGAGRDAYARGHIPGAVFADLDRDLASPPGEAGRHPLPTAEAFEATMARLGIGDEARVIAYDDQGGATAARLWFLLRYFGHETGAVLDGGIDAFTAAGHTLATTVPTDGTGGPPFVAHTRHGLAVGKDVVKATLHHAGALLLDARAPERYRGESEPVDPRAGHIPSAVNAPYAENLDAGRFRSADTLAERYRALGAWDKETTVYCGSGVTACHDLLALALAGHERARLYAGSWSEWSTDKTSEVAVGE
jgi:thiosulfate/3-mercaptopyruvate sulfurtransferase